MSMYNKRNCPLVLIPASKIRPGDVYYYHGTDKEHALARQFRWWEQNNPTTTTGNVYDLSTRRGALRFGFSEASEDEVREFQMYRSDCWASVWRGCPAPDRYVAACKAFADFDFSSDD